MSPKGFPYGAGSAFAKISTPKKKKKYTESELKKFLKSWMSKFPERDQKKVKRHNRKELTVWDTKIEQATAII